MPSGSRIGTGPDHWCPCAGLADICARAAPGPRPRHPARPRTPAPTPALMPTPTPALMPAPAPASVPARTTLRPAVGDSPSVVMPHSSITTDAHSHHRPATPPVRFIRSTYTLPDWFPFPTLPFGLENLSGSINVR